MLAEKSLGSVVFTDPGVAAPITISVNDANHLTIQAGPNRVLVITAGGGLWQFTKPGSLPPTGDPTDCTVGPDGRIVINDG